MVKLAFVIPTWNRPARLEVCVESIAKQIEPGQDVRIIVLDDASDDPKVKAVMDRMLVKYDGIEFRERDEHGDYSRSFKYAFASAPDAEWVWTMGDDEKLRDNALAFMLNDVLPKMGERRFLHVAELGRESGRNVITYADRLLDLCCAYGWTDMTGFLSGNVTRGDWLAKASESPNWRTYSKSAFVQSCSLLETLRHEPCAFVDIPLIRTQTRTPEEEAAGTAQWAAGNTSERYLYLADALEVMFEQGILDTKLPNKFFRYLNYHLWDRFFIGYINDYNQYQGLWTDELWGRVSRLAKFLADEEMAKSILQEAEMVRGLATLCIYQKKNHALLHNQIVDIGLRHNGPFYPYTFIEADPAKEAA